MVTGTWPLVPQQPALMVLTRAELRATLSEQHFGPPTPRAVYHSTHRLHVERRHKTGMRKTGQRPSSASAVGIDVDQSLDFDLVRPLSYSSSSCLK